MLKTPFATISRFLKNIIRKRRNNEPTSETKSTDRAGDPNDKPGHPGG